LKVWVISYYYKSHNNPRSFRWTALVSEFVKEGHNVKVFDSNFIISNIKEKNSHVFKEKYFLLHNSFFKILNAIFSFVRWPDFAWLWAFFCYKNILKEIEINGLPDLIVTVSHPFSSHCVGYFLRRKFSNLKWIADVGDPFFHSVVPINNLFLYKKLNLIFEKKVVQSVDNLIVTTHQTKKKYANDFSAKYVNVIGPLISDLTLRNIENTIKYKKNTRPSSETPTIKILYLGTLYRELRSPISAIELFERLSNKGLRFRLYFVGMNAKILQNYKTKKYVQLFLKSEIPHSSVFKLIRNADILLNISNSSNFQLPSKVVEYIATGKPIINITNCNNDLSGKFFANYKNTLNVNVSKKINTHAFDSFILNSMKHKKSYRDISIFKQSFVGRKYCRILNRVYEKN
jgi:hypothetical protein